MTTSAVLSPPRARQPGERHDAEILSRLRKANGQLAGITSMYEEGRYCIDILDQLAAARAAIDAVGLILLQDHINACVRDAIDSGDSDEKVTELVTAVRRFLRSR
jgi:CsoR family transcriptional regulator, copper-sensing transcriptional repressor